MAAQVWGLCALLLVVPAAIASTIDWERATDGIPHEQTMAFGGCHPAEALDDQKAYKIALLRARANMAKARNIEISGEERIITAPGGKPDYELNIVETSSAFLGRIVVVHSEMAMVDNRQQLCLLVREMPLNKNDEDEIDGGYQE